jgi:hypothetical protein
MGGARGAAARATLERRWADPPRVDLALQGPALRRFPGVFQTYTDLCPATAAEKLRPLGLARSAPGPRRHRV